MGSVEFVETAVYRLRMPSEPGGFKYLAAGPYLEGEYKKWNDNSGKVLVDSKSFASSVSASDAAQAFSHYTYHKGKGKEIVVDIQGVCESQNGPGSINLVLTDPQLHSLKGKTYGRGDCGEDGIKAFFKTHKCNGLCKALELPEPNKSFAWSVCPTCI